MFDVLELVISSARESSGSDVSAIIWNSRTGEKINTFRGGGYSVPHGLAVSGGYLFGIDENKPLLHTWCLNSIDCGSAGQLLMSKPRCVDVASSIKLVALGSEDGIQVYEVGTGRLIANVGRKFHPICTIKFSKDGLLIACGALDGTIIVWNTGTLITNGETAEPFLVFEGHSLPVNDLIFTSGGLRSRIISVSTDRTCKVHELVSGILLSTVIYDVALTTLALHMNENHVFIGNKNGGIHILTLNLTQFKSGRCLTHSDQDVDYSGHTDEITSLSCSSHQALLLSGSADGTVKVWDIITKNCLRSLEHKGKVTNAFFTLVPFDFIEKNFKPSLQLPNHCIPYDTSAKGKPEEIITPLTLSTHLSLPICDKKYEDTDEGVNNEEITKLKRINHSLYLFSVARILKKKLKFNSGSGYEANTFKLKNSAIKTVKNVNIKSNPIRNRKKRS